MPRSSATQHELARVPLLAGLPGELLMRLGKEMAREELAPGTNVGGDDRFYVVFAGMLSSGDGIVKPGGTFAAARAITPCVVASCDRATYDELLRPQLGDD